MDGEFTPLKAPLPAGFHAGGEGQDPPRWVDDRARENSTVDPLQGPSGPQAIEPIASDADARATPRGCPLGALRAA